MVTVLYLSLDAISPWGLSLKKTLGIQEWLLSWLCFISFIFSDRH